MVAEVERSLTECEIRDLVATAVSHIDDPDPQDPAVLTPAWQAIAILQLHFSPAIHCLAYASPSSTPCRRRRIRSRSHG
jgi:hypothetical protein